LQWPLGAPSLVLLPFIVTVPARSRAATRCARDGPGLHESGAPVGGVVGDDDSLWLGVERDDDEHRPKDLFARAVWLLTSA